MATYPIRQLTKLQRLMGGVALFRPTGAQKWIKIGPVESVEFTPSVTTVDQYTNEFGDRRLLRKITTTKEGSVVLNGIQMWTEWLYQALFMASKKYKTQAVAADQELIVEAVAVGDVVSLPGIKGTISAITDGESVPVSYVENTHYIFHPATGMIEFIAKPAGAGEDAIVEYDLPAVTAADALLDLAIMETSGTRGEFRYIGITVDGNGDPVDMYLPDVEFLPNGAVAAGDTANANTGSLTGSVYATADKGYGSVTGLQKIVNA
ncbi:phage tail tube protein [Sinorhizobium meliloti]|uniref:phage tail tube protein n=1 Tax=Rhizobium meliloti TaxID=382 RepID=UPI000FE03494|nr:hypothetical protein [Sinorhizobium meliloti]MDX1216313.1 hypothetical protein [Sinorhizobium medicae]RVG70907.1 hypothetical protein CN222_01860 [Sinorhizobium meliloti]